jgi:transposase InsO family protein
MPDEHPRHYILAAIDRATRWVYVEILKDKSVKSAKAFLQHLIQVARVKIQKVFTDNGEEFTDRFCATGQGQPTGTHLFNKACSQHGIDHRFIKPRHPQTNGMVERFNGRISEVLKTIHFDSAQSLEQTITHYVQLYNHSIPNVRWGISPLWRP